ncbi:hypothetical protein LCGC14_1126450 [marine sediment metagenome]|uniref:Uncharacterized protein n=1 Tax=marine sediment metagenome TaxID=412755 RepID=A0A0F9MQE7_9ZZZZ
MTDYISFTIPGRPIPMGRSKSTKAGHHYTPIRTRVWQEQARPFVQQAMAGREMLEGPVALEIIFGFTPPKSWAKSKKDKSIGDSIISKNAGDLDNLVSNCMNLMTGIVYKDDSQVSSLLTEKFYWNEDYVSLKLWGHGSGTGREVRGFG